MYRETSFAENEYYHIYSRGVEKRKIFMNDKDHKRFTALLYIMNQNQPFRMDDFLRGNKNNLENIFKLEKENEPIRQFFRVVQFGLVRPDGGFDYAAISHGMDAYDVPRPARRTSRSAAVPRR